MNKPIRLFSICFHLLIILLIFISCKNQKKTFSPSQQKALYFILNNQEPNGSWLVIKHDGNYQNKDGIIAVTSIALISLLHHPKRNTNKQVKKSIENGLAFLWKNQKTKGNIGKHNYANGLSFYATSLAITKKYSKVTDQHSKLFNNIISKQSQTGAWDYLMANNHRNDLSISAWIALGLAECLHLKKYQNEAKKAIDRLNLMLSKDQFGAGDDTITTKGDSAYTYGNQPNLKPGKETRKPGSTIQAIVLRIKIINNIKCLNSNWTLKAINDQSAKKIKPEKINYYRLFFYSSLLNKSKSNKYNNWKSNTLMLIKKSQMKDGSFPLTTINMKFGGKIMSTAIAFLTVNQLGLYR